MAAVMQSSDTLPRATAAPAKTCGFTLLSPLTPKDRCHRLTMAAVMQSSDTLPREAAARAKTVVLLSYHLTPKDRCHRLTIVAVMQSSEPLPRATAAPAKNLWFYSPITSTLRRTVANG